MSNGILYLVELEVSEGKEEALRELAKEMVESTAKELGTLNYHWALNGNICHTIEHYESNQATADHLAHFNENFADRFMALGTVTSCTVYGEPNEEVKNILDGFGSKYFSTIETYSR
ncbi:putative quinol monooxygenase [Marinilactibacillus psychrotolerans]|uniref:ABM domain-containing protein n=1 Tax=Marinilactibacillus psychrotolerans TaxID=191770 RepID=A0AAV3WQQ7_9LACT|nr:antibiotic biosynthesis monooxygenase [Marinilactibacillus psychrotolerans]GEL67457.1 hypothetical protein MPS01_16120 [Marinilactibacillus psychrotolerans]GEQ35617.1 hypothetical protein M132T_11250 [Marinilactibacillus psychrotolerans]SDC70765.1 Quinol monooxygenase YgiN [Marinilactibacillus psychrotolerans]